MKVIHYKQIISDLEDRKNIEISNPNTLFTDPDLKKKLETVYRWLSVDQGTDVKPFFPRNFDKK